MENTRAGSLGTEARQQWSQHVISSHKDTGDCHTNKSTSIPASSTSTR